MSLFLFPFHLNRIRTQQQPHRSGLIKVRESVEGSGCSWIITPLSMCVLYRCFTPFWRMYIDIHNRYVIFMRFLYVFNHYEIILYQNGLLSAFSDPLRLKCGINLIRPTTMGFSLDGMAVWVNALVINMINLRYFVLVTYLCSWMKFMSSSSGVRSVTKAEIDF